MAGVLPPNVVLPTLTKVRHQAKYTKRLTCVDPYQTLPESLLAMRNPLVILVWSTNCYQSADLGLNLPYETFTNHYHRGQETGH